VSALVRQLIEDGLVIRTEEKRKAYFELADLGEDEEVEVEAEDEE
jgi:predicted transcriptional regulator